MKLVRIFVSDDSEEGLWSIHLDDEQQNEFEKFFDLINDVEWIYNFFEKNKVDLGSGFFGKISVSQAVERTLDEIEEMESILYDYAEQGFSRSEHNLQHLFKPLNNFEYTISIHQKSKARIKKGWLRLYAIRLSSNCYLVTGGAIKLTQDMKRKHLQDELKKLNQTKTYLRNNGIEYPEDLNTYQDE